MVNLEVRISSKKPELIGANPSQPFNQGRTRQEDLRLHDMVPSGPHLCLHSAGNAARSERERADFSPTCCSSSGLGEGGDSEKGRRDFGVEEKITKNAYVRASIDEDIYTNREEEDDGEEKR